MACGLLPQAIFLLGILPHMKEALTFSFQENSGFQRSLLIWQKAKQKGRNESHHS